MKILLDLFSGIGGFHLGLIQAGFKFDEVYFSEIDKYAVQIYKRNFPNAKELGDIKSIQQPPKADIVTFGFPCQDLSIAGKRGGLEASRSSLFFEAIRIIQDSKPDYFIFENVKGLFSSNNGKDFDIVLRAIADIGYDGQWQLLNTRWFLPQNRERIYFVGYSRNRSRPEIFPIGETDKGDRETQERPGREEPRVWGNNTSIVANSLGTSEGSIERNLIANTITGRYFKDGSENLIRENKK